MIGSYLLLKRTSFGLRVRAALENPALARASGISTNMIYAVTFAFGAALAGLAGALVVPVFSLFADLGMRFLIQGFLAVMLGGVGTFEGPVAGPASSASSARPCRGPLRQSSPMSWFSCWPSSSSNSDPGVCWQGGVSDHD